MNRKHLNIVQFLLENGFDINAQGGRYGSVLQEASCRGYEVTVRVLLEEGADANICSHMKFDDKGGRTPLVLASMNGSKAVVELLLGVPDLDPSFKDGERRW